MIMIDAALERFVSNVDIIILCEEEFLKWRILFSTIQVSRSELVVVADHPVHGVPEYDHQLGLVVRLPHPLRHAWSVEVSRSLLHPNLILGDQRHLINVPLHSLAVPLVVEVNLILGSLDLGVHVEKLQQCSGASFLSSYDDCLG